MKREVSDEVTAHAVLCLGTSQPVDAGDPNGHMLACPHLEAVWYILKGQMCLMCFEYKTLFLEKYT